LTSSHYKSVFDNNDEEIRKLNLTIISNSSKMEEQERRIAELNSSLSSEISKNDSRSKQIKNTNLDINQLLKVVQHSREKTSLLESKLSTITVQFQENVQLANTRKVKFDQAIDKLNTEKDITKVLKIENVDLKSK